ncbi:MAG: hypothetical protein WC538_08570 [Thermoanaerobaculia bacterium]
MGDPVDVFASIDLLFPGRKHNVIDLCELRLRTYTREGKQRTARGLLRRGDIIRGERVVLKPLDSERSYDGSQLGHAITAQINSNYWLIAFWERLLENAMHSELAREMVRAFVLQCGLVVVESLYDQKRMVDHTYISGQGLMNISDFYRKAFNWTQVFKLMRLKHRETLRERVARNPDYKKLHGCTDADVIAALPEVNLVLSESGLDQLVNRPEKNNARNILVTLTLMCSSWRNNQKLRKGLMKALLRPKMV